LKGSWRFENFRLDCGQGELWSGDQPVALSPKEFETLRVLVENAGRLVSKEELISRVWPDSFVGDNSLARNISALRKILGGELIQTVARRGYRFAQKAVWEPETAVIAQTALPEIESVPLPGRVASAGPVEAETGRGTPVDGISAEVVSLAISPPRQRWIRFALAAVPTLVLIGAVFVGSQNKSREDGTRPVRIAVLPFVNLTGDPNEEYLCDGLTEAMIAELSRLSPDGLSVIARTSAMHYKGTTEPIPQIGRELNVDYVLESSVRGSSERARITSQLVRASDATHHWTGEYERDLKDIISVQQEVAISVAGEIQLNLNSEVTTRLHGVHPVDSDAYRDYLLGQFYWNKRNGQGLQKALDYFQKSVERDPQFALGWAGLANAHIMLAGPSLHVRAEYALARAAAQKSLELDANLPQAHTALAYVLMWDDWDWNGAEAHYRRALEIDPSDANAHHWYALYLIGMKRPQEAIREIRRAMELDPLSLGISYNGGFIYTLAGMRPEAEQQLKRALEIDPNNAVAHGILAIVYQRNKDYEKSLAEFRIAQRLAGGPVPYLAGVASVEALVGDRAGADRDLTELLKLHEEHKLADSSLVFVYAPLGEKDAALRYLASSVEERSISLIEMNNDELFDGLRNDPRFIELLKKMKLQH
jgi:TolB-like protein/DNA-binding winged helix-turn-helix (wHTH) protein/Flp pilus assembly protein TadD